MKIHHLSVAEALQSLHTGPAGLTADEAARRLHEFGPNRIASVEGPQLLRRLIQGFVHFFALILWVAAALAFLAEWQEPGSGMGMLGVAIVGVILVNALFSFWQEFRAEQAMAALQKLLPHKVKVLRDGKTTQVPADELTPGDVILLDDGDDIPADCRLIEGFGVRVNNATVTGESLPQARDAQPSNEQELLHSRNVLLAGTSVVAGQARAVVFATGMHTEFGKIAHLTQSTRAFLSPLQQEIQRLSRLVVVIAVALGAVFFLIGQVLGLSFWANVLFAIGIIVANVPEGLLPTVTLALAMGSQRMARKNALIRHLPSVETLGSATVICTDKTGTLTQNRLAVKRVFLSRQFHDVAKLTNPSLVSAHRAFFEVACHCHTLKEMAEQDRDILAGDPLEVALRRMAQEARPESSEYPRIDEVPFDSDRRRLSTLHRTPQGLMLYTKGALEALEPLCTHLFTGGKVQVLDAALRKELSNAQDALAAEGLRVLALAHRAVSANYNPDRLEEQLILVGLVGLADPPRPEVPDAVAKCRQAGIKVIMVTGDHPHTSRAIAKEIGLTGERPVVITGDKLRCLSATQLQLALDQPEILFARVSADQKMRIVQALKAKNHVVAVTGDGVNDAPALRAGDIGIAMGRTGTDVARAAADMVLLDDNFASIVAAIEEGRAVFANIRKFLTYILTSNVPELVPYLAFVLFKLPLALPIIQILAVDLGTDLLPALALGAETPEPGAMHRPPRPRTDRLLDWSLLLRSYGFLGVLEAMGALAAFFFVLVGAGWSYGQVLSPTDPVYLQATTACLSAIIVMQIANVFLCRSERSSSFSVSVFSNPLIWVGIAAELVLILLVDYTNLGNRLFGTAPIAWSVWLFVLPFAVGMFTLEEVRKLLLRFSVSSRD